MRLVHVALGSPDKDEVRRLVERLVGEAFAANQLTAFQVFEEHVSNHRVSEAQRIQLLARCYEGYDASSIPQKVIDVFESTSGGNVCYSQEGEDILLARFFGEEANGFFVDVGALHPTRFSNTFALYKKGWHGINIDATPGSMESFRKLRPRDINLEVAISDKQGPLLLSVFKEGALNTFDSSLAASYIGGGWEEKERIELHPRTLASVLDEYLPVGQAIDLLSVDVEGEDLGVLRSNDWGRFSPEVVVVEVLDTPILSLRGHPIVTFLADRGYSPLSRLYNSVILRRQAS